MVVWVRDDGKVTARLISSNHSKPPRVNYVVSPQVYSQAQVFDLPIAEDTIVDLEDQPLTWRADTADNTGLPSGLEFNATSLIFTGQLFQIGDWNISLQATNPEGLSAVTFFALQIAQFKITMPCTIVYMSNYASDSLVCSSVRNTLIAIPTLLGTILCAVFYFWCEKRQVEKSWSDASFHIHNLLRHELKLEITQLGQENKYESAIYQLIGRLLRESRLERESDIDYNSRMGRRVVALSPAERDRYGSALLSAIREHIQFPKLCCDASEAKEIKGVDATMPIYRYFYGTIPAPLPCLTTYQFKTDVLLAASDAIMVSTRQRLIRVPAENKIPAAPSTSCCVSVMGFFSRCRRSRPQDRPQPGAVTVHNQGRRNEHRGRAVFHHASAIPLDHKHALAPVLPVGQQPEVAALAFGV